MNLDNQPAASDTQPDPFAIPDQATHIEDVFGPGFEQDEPPAKEEVEAKDDTSPPSVGAGEGEEPGALEGAPGSEPAKAPAAATPPSDVELENTSLKAERDRLAAELEEAKKSKEPDAGTEPKPEDKPAATEIEPVSIKLPAPLRDKLLSDEPEDMIAGIEEIISTISTNTLRMVQPLYARLKAYEDAAKGSAAPVIDTSPADTAAADAARQKMQDDYYAKFPAHKGPEFLPILASVSGEMAALFPGHEWNDTYIASMGAKVTERAKKLAALMAGGKAPAPPLQPGSRSATPGSGDGDIADEIADTLGW